MSRHTGTERVSARVGGRLAALALFSVVMMALTGAFLAFYYQPAPERAHASVYYLSNYVNHGWLIRSAHAWGARLLLLLASVEIIRIAVSRGWTGDGRRRWFAGLALLVLTVAFLTTGDVLRWDRRGYEGAVAALDLFGRLPVVGPWLAHLAAGGPKPGAAMLTRSFALHVTLLPALLSVLVLAVLATRRRGARRRSYRAHAEAAVPAATAIVIVMLALSVACIFAPATLGERADTRAPLAQAQPAWYLRVAEAPWEWAPPVVGVLGPLLVLAVLIALPYVDRRRRPAPAESADADVPDTAPRPEARANLRLDRSIGVLLLASLALNSLILTAYLTSSATESPAERWAAAAHRLVLRIRPIDAERDAAALSALHIGARSVSDARCIACHGTMLSSGVAFHRIHLENELLPGLRCGDCHRRVDLTARDNRTVVEWVDVALCKKCHSPFPGSDEPGASMTPKDFEIDCTMCHAGEHAFRHDSPYLSQIIAPRECTGCHGGRVLPWDPMHERDDWLDRHGAEALRSGDDACFACHDFGLKFCDTCHELKPPSHQPADAWKRAHRDAARADTRACHTCHDVADCRRCHLSHEEGWLERHPATVRRDGSVKCEHCHSTSFCGYCHTQHSTGASATDPALTKP